VAVAVALLYFFLGLAALGLLIAPVMLVKRAFSIRPLQRKWRKIQGDREVLPMEVQASALYKWYKVEIERFHNTRTLALVSLTLVGIGLESPILLKGFKLEKIPTALEDINALAPKLYDHVSKTFGTMGLLYVGIGVAVAVGAAMIAVNLLDLLGDLLGTPVRAAKNRIEDAARQAREEREEAERAAKLAATAPSTTVTNYYEELDIPPNATPGEAADLIKGFRRKWEKREAAGNPAAQEKARRMLDLLDQAQAVLLDPAKRADFDRQLGVRGGPAGAEPAPTKKQPVDPRQVSGETLRHIEEMKRRRQAEKAVETGGSKPRQPWNPNEPDESAESDEAGS